MNVSNRESIRHFTEKLKSFLVDQTTLFGLIILAVGIASFCLGRLSVDTACYSNPNLADRIALCPTVLTPNVENLDIFGSTPTTGVVAGAATTGATSALVYVASKNGTKYHHITCAGAKQIKKENKLFFTSPATAEAAGYSRAANCNK